MKLTTKTKVYELSQRSYIMGILNVTPDSFSDGGEWNTVEKAVAHALEMVADGADIIDIGGESTRPGHTQISDEEEIARIVPVIEALKKAVDVPLSIDTYKSAVARAACEAGVDIINDIWGCRYDPQIAAVAASFDVPIILMHNREKPDYAFLIEDMLADLAESVRIAVSAGVGKGFPWMTKSLPENMLHHGLSCRGVADNHNCSGIGHCPECHSLTPAGPAGCLSIRRRP